MGYRWRFAAQESLPMEVPSCIYFLMFLLCIHFLMFFLFIHFQMFPTKGRVNGVHGGAYQWRFAAQGGVPMEFPLCIHFPMFPTKGRVNGVQWGRTNGDLLQNGAYQ